MIKQRTPQLQGLPIEARTDIHLFWDQVILPYRRAPVLRRQGAQAELVEMQFSLVPRWSKEARVKFATHNARIETIDEKATWKDAFSKRHCLVPMTHFIEPIYEGEYAGFMVAFHGYGEELLLAAGIWEEWIHAGTGEVLESFTIITGEPPPYISRIGHDRCPIFLPAADQVEWLSNEGREPSQLKKFLLQASPRIEFGVDRQRPMKPGWEKRK